MATDGLTEPEIILHELQGEIGRKLAGKAEIWVPGHLSSARLILRVVPRNSQRWMDVILRGTYFELLYGESRGARIELSEPKCIEIVVDVVKDWVLRSS